MVGQDDTGDKGRVKAPGGSSDWDRYGLSQREESASTQQSAGRPIVRREPGDDLYLEYMRENASRSRSGGGRSPRRRANLLAIVAIAVAAVLVVAVAMATAPPGPTPTPAPTPGPTVLPTNPQATEVATIPASSASAEVVQDVPAAKFALPFPVDVPDRANQPDDNVVTMYLTGASGGVAIDLSTGSTEKTFAGAAFADGVGRSIVAGGSLWVSSWPSTYAACGPACWHLAKTYQLGLVTGKLAKTYDGTYLVGELGQGLVLADSNGIEFVDPTTGEKSAGLPWPGNGEPRVGCGSLWSFDAAVGQPTITRFNLATATVGASNALANGEAYGPVQTASGCWMMTGMGGVSTGSTSLAQLDTDGRLVSATGLASSVVFLDGQFWTYDAGLLQRYDPSMTGATGGMLGPVYQLTPVPAGGDPSLLFASLGYLWALEGNQLVEYSAPLVEVVGL